MPLGDWNEIIQYYNEMLDYFKDDVPKNSIGRATEFYIKHMLDFIPSVWSLPELGSVLPGTSHMVLFFTFSEKIYRKVSIWYSEDGIYTVSIDHHDDGNLDSTTVTPEEVVPTLIAYIERMKSMESNS
jgi:hypothetical protein